MKSQITAKLSFLLDGIKSRMNENEEIFVKVDGYAKSGKVSYPFYIHKMENGYEFSFKKDVSTLSFNDAVDCINNESRLYDEIIFNFYDRVSTLTITANDKRVNVNTKNENNFFEEKKGESHIISPSKAKELLFALDFAAEDGKLKNSHIRKFNQVENFLKLLAPYVEKLPRDRTIYMYDLACGKSYLSFFINYYFCDVVKRKCHITGIDIRQDVVDSSIKIRDSLKYYNMDFVCVDIVSYVPENPFDVAVSLHACDVATDYAIAAAINNGAKVVAFVPCCHKELANQIMCDEKLDFITEHPILKKRFADVFTDAYRVKVLEENGYNMTLTEFVSPLDTPKNLIMLGNRDGKRKNNVTDKIENNFGVDPILKKLIIT